MDKQEHQICELMEDCVKRLQAVAHTVDRVWSHKCKNPQREPRRKSPPPDRTCGGWRMPEDWGEYMIEENGEYTSLHPLYEKAVYDGRRLIRFADARRAEIARLRAKHDRRHAPRRRRGRRRLPHRHATGAEVRASGAPAEIAVSPASALLQVPPDPMQLRRVSRPGQQGEQVRSSRIAALLVRRAAPSQMVREARRLHGRSTSPARPTTPSSWTQIRSRRVSNATGQKARGDGDAEMKLRVREWIHPDHALSKTTLKRGGSTTRSASGTGSCAVLRPIQGRGAARLPDGEALVLRSGTQRGRTPWNARVPSGAPKKTWDSWMAYRRRYNDSVTPADWMAKRFGVRIGKVRHNFSTLQRSPAEIAAKINAMATR